MLDPRRFKEFLTYTLEHEAMLKKEIQQEYEKVVKATEEWDKRKNYAMLRSQLEQDQNDHKQAVEDFKKEREAYTAKMNDWHAKLTQTQADTIAKKAAVDQQASALDQAKAEHAANVSSANAAHQARASLLDKMEKELQEFQKALHQREKELSAKHDKVRQAMNTLSELRP